VTAIARQATDKLAGRAGVTPLDVDASAPVALQAAVVGHDAVITATRFSELPLGSIVAAVKAAGVPRLMVVGGAASLLVGPGQRLLDTPSFPAAYKAKATAAAEALEALREAHARLDLSLALGAVLPVLGSTGAW
jgi:putative NADH-flavin reductase